VSPARAVDIALLPPADVSTLAARLNRALDGGTPGGLTLDEGHLPHVTLVQLFLADSRLPDLFARVDDVAATAAAIDVRVLGVDAASGTSMLVFDGNDALQALHRRLMDAASAFETTGGVEAFLPAEPPARPRDVDWVTTYRTAHAFGSFVPHVTLGHGTGAGPIEPFTFRADRLAICSLGRFCTCTHVLHDLILETC
jgi:2'-5' RNA ligase